MAEQYVPLYYGGYKGAFLSGNKTDEEKELYKNFFNTAEKCKNDLESYVTKKANAPVPADTVEKYGIDMVKYVLATNILDGYHYKAEWGDEYDWIKDTRISEDVMDRYDMLFDIDVDAESISALATEVMKMNVVSETKTVNETMTKDEPKELPDLTSEEINNMNETFRFAHVMPSNSNVAVNSDGGVTVTMPKDALIRTFPTAGLFAMPRNGKYEGYKFMVGKSNFFPQDDGTIIVRATNNGPRPAREDPGLTIKDHDKTVRLSPSEVAFVFSKAKEEDYIPKIYKVEIPRTAVTGEYENVVRCRFPDQSKYKGLHFIIPKDFRNYDESGLDSNMFDIPDYADFAVRDRDGNDMFLRAAELANEMSDGTYTKRVSWVQMNLDRAAHIQTFDRNTMFKMPETGEYAGYTYYIPNGMITNFAESAFTDADYNIRFPENKIFGIRKGTDKKEINLEQYLKAVNGKSAKDYVKAPPVQTKHEDQIQSM